MNRFVGLTVMVVIVAAGAIAFAAGQPLETALGECASGADSVRVSVREISGETAGTLVVSAGGAGSRQSFNLQTPAYAKMLKTLIAPVTIAAVDQSDANNVVAAFGVADADGDAKSICVWLNKSNGRWTCRGEWAVEKFNHKELGEKDEKQACAFDSGGILKRGVKRNKVEGVKTTCAQGCCVVWQSRTLVTEELETLAWNAETKRAERKTYRRWYVTQHGDGVLSIAQKVFGNPAKLTTLLRLNPELQKQETLVDDQRILIESEAK